MYWLQRPPYLRWAAAVLAVIAAIAWDIRPRPTDLRPFAATDAAAGDPVTVEWREVPAGILPHTEIGPRVAAVDLTAGDPVVPAVLTEPPLAPDGWLAVPIEAARHARAGERVLMVAGDPPITTTGVVLAAAVGDGYGFDTAPALVAVPPEDAALVAAADRSGSLIVAVDR